MSFAEWGCVVKVDFECEACKYGFLEMLSSIIGEFRIEIEGNLVKIDGEVEPNRLAKALAKSGKHYRVLKGSFNSANWNPYNSTSLPYHRMPTTFPMDYGHHHYAGGMYGGGVGPGMYGGAGLGPMSGGHHYPYNQGSGEGYPFGRSGMHGGHGFHSGQDYPFRGSTMHGGHRFHPHHRHSQPPMGGGFAGAGYPPHGYGGM